MNSKRKKIIEKCINDTRQDINEIDWDNPRVIDDILNRFEDDKYESYDEKEIQIEFWKIISSKLNAKVTASKEFISGLRRKIEDMRSDEIYSRPKGKKRKLVMQE